MVNDEGQLYTLEGITAALIMIVSMYLVLGTTVVYTPGDTHITDMQLEQLGNDALRMMDTPSDYDTTSELANWIVTNGKDAFKSNFGSYIQSRTSGVQDSQLQFNATIYYRMQSNSSIGSYHFADSNQPYSGRDPAVRVTRWVQIWKKPFGSGVTIPPTMDNRDQAVLLEVLIWRS